MYLGCQLRQVALQSLCVVPQPPAGLPCFVYLMEKVQQEKRVSSLMNTDG